MILITRPKSEGRQLCLMLSKEKMYSFHEPLTDFIFKKIYKININHKIFIISSLQATKAIAKEKIVYKKFLSEARIFVIGVKVKNALKKIGTKKIEKTFLDSFELIKYLKKNRLYEKKFIYLCSNVVNKEFIKTLKDEQFQIRKKIVYETIPSHTFSKRLQKLLAEDKIEIVVFFSHYSSKIFFKLISKYELNASLKNIKAVCISKRIADNLKRNYSLKTVKISKKPDQTSVIRELKKVYF